MSRGRVCLLIPYFGEAPVYWPAFVASVAHSRLIDVVLFSDCLPTTGLPDNVRCHATTLEAVRDDLRRLLGASAELPVPYKLCDYKPLYAELFSEHVAGREFWAYGDLDLVFGDVDAWLGGLLDGHDVISFRRDWLSGSLTVLRNRADINALYRESTMLAQVMATRSYSGFDEAPGPVLAQAQATCGASYQDAALQTFTALVFRAHFAGRLRLHAANMALEWLGKRRLRCADGQIVDDAGVAHPYYHFVCEKSSTRFAWRGDVPYPVHINPWGYAADAWPRASFVRAFHAWSRRLYARLRKWLP